MIKFRVASLDGVMMSKGRMPGLNHMVRVRSIDVRSKSCSSRGLELQFVRTGIGRATSHQAEVWKDGSKEVEKIGPAFLVATSVCHCMLEVKMEESLGKVRKGVSSSAGAHQVYSFQSTMTTSLQYTLDLKLIVRAISQSSVSLCFNPL